MAPQLRARPNPFSLRTEIHCRLSRYCRIDVRIHDVTGRLVRSLHEGPLGAGDHVWSWDGRTAGGGAAGAGVYFLTAETPDRTTTLKLYRLH